MVLTLARDRDQAKVVFNYIRGIVESIPVLKAMVVTWRADEIELNNGIVIGVKTADFRGIRGITVACAICDEIAFWDAVGVNPDRAILQALRPSMATLKESRLLVISSPYAKFGALYQAYRDYYGKDDAPALVWQAPTTVMNPTIAESFVAEEMQKDPESGRSEWLAMFREDVEQAFSLESLEQCVIPGRGDLMPVPNIIYRVFVDPSGGRRDQFAVAVGHRKGNIAMIDLVKSWSAPFDPSEVIKQCTEVLKPFRIRTVVGDAFAGEFPPMEFRKLGIQYNVANKNRSQLYLDLIPVINSRRCELPDNRKLIDELRRLERKRGRSGRDSVDHPGTGHDDIANAVAGAVDLIMSKPTLSPYAVPTGPTVKNPFSSTLGSRHSTGEAPSHTGIAVPVAVGTSGWSLSGSDRDSSGGFYQGYRGARNIK